MKQRTKVELRRGARYLYVVPLMLLMGISGGYFLLSNVNVHWPGQERYEVRLAVDDAKGVSAGTNQQVRIAGVRVGAITGVDHEDGRAVVTATIDPEHAPLYRDARLELRPATALQDMYLAIVSRGSRSAGAVAPGDVVPSFRTRTPVDVSDVLDVLNVPTRAHVATLLHELRDGLAPEAAASLERSFVEFAPFLVSVRDVTRALAVRRHRVARVVSNLRAVSSALARRDRDLSRMVRAGGTTLRSVAGQRGALGRTLDALPRTLASLRSGLRALDAARAGLDPAITSLGPVAANLRPAAGALDDLAGSLTPAARALKPAIRDLRPLLRATPGLGDDLADAMAELRPQVPQLRRINQTLVGCAPAFQKFFHWTISMFKLSDAYGVIPRGQATSSGPSTSSVAKDPTIDPDPPSCTDRRTP